MNTDTQLDMIAYCIGELICKSLADGPIQHQPNEILRPILEELEMHELIHLRLVCHRWKAVIESIGHTKKSLILSCGMDDADVEGLSRRFFGEMNVKREFVHIKLVNLSGGVSELRALLLALFPKVEQLVIKAPSFGVNLHSVLTLWPSQQITTLSLIGQLKHRNHKVTHYVDSINSFTSLKRFDLSGNFRQFLDLLSEELFGRLEHFSYAGPYGLNFVRHLGPNCTRLYLSGSNYLLKRTELDQWFSPDMISGITHLSLPVRTNDDLFWPFLCDKFVSVRTLQIHDNYYQNNLSPQLTNVLSRMSNLTDLQLYGFCIYFNRWSDLDQLSPLATVHSCTLRLNGRYEINLPRLAQILRAIFPNLIKFDYEKPAQHCIQ